MLHQTRVKGADVVSGRTLRDNADAEVREAKKILPLLAEAVKCKILHPPKDGEYSQVDPFVSGKLREDLLDFLIARMYHWKHFNGPSGMSTLYSGPSPPSTPEPVKQRTSPRRKKTT